VFSYITLRYDPLFTELKLGPLQFSVSAPKFKAMHASFHHQAKQFHACYKRILTADSGSILLLTLRAD